MRPRVVVAIIGAALALSGAGRAAAQATRAEALQQQRSEKARTVAPYEPGKIEKLFALVGERESGGKPLGFYPYVGSIQQGGLVAVGVGYRYPFMDTGRFSIEFAGTPRLYWKADAKLRVPLAAGGKVSLDTRAILLDAPKAPFYGLGNETPDERTNFRVTPTTFEGVVTARPRDWFRLGGGVSYLSVNQGRGRGPEPPVDDVFTAEILPGLGVDPSYVVPTVFAEVDWRDSPGYPTRGGQVETRWSAFSETSGKPYSFHRLEASASHYIPLLRNNWVIALRARLVTTNAPDGEDVPYFLMPTLGGSRDLRGFSTFRFRDRNSLILTAEYRWTPSRILDMAVFYDAGKVASHLQDLDLSDLHDSYGIGARVHTSDATLIRLDVARSREGLRFIFGVGANF